MSRRELTATMVLAIVLALLPGSVLAADYVVNPRHPRSSDENPGTAASPWKTIGKAAQTVASGDTVYVMPGTYDERVTLTTSGTEEAKITFKAAPRHAAQVLGFDTGDADHVRIEGFYIAHTDRGVSITSDDVEVVDNFFSHVRGWPVVGRQRADGDYQTPARAYVAYNKAYYCNWGVNAAGRDWLIESNDVERLVNTVSDDSDYARFFGRGHVFRSNRFHGTSRIEKRRAHTDGWQFFSNNGEIATRILLEYNMVTDTGQGLMSSNVRQLEEARDWTIRNNVLCLRGWGSNMLQLHGIPDVKVLHNTFVDCRWFGVGMSRGGQDVLIQGNVFSGVRGSVYGTRDAEGYAIRGNLVDLAGDPLDGYEGDILAEPRFADREAMNFRLTEGSPAIDSGEGGTDRGALPYPNVYFVDPRHPGATDEFWGYPAVPFRTLERACEVAQTGETIMLRDGVHRGLIKPRRPGVTVKAWQDEKAVVSGADLITGWEWGRAGWSAPLATAPKTVLRDGQPFTDFTYDGAAGRITVPRRENPHLHVFERVVRPHAVDLRGLRGASVEGIATAATLEEPVIGSEGNDVSMADYAVDYKALIGSGPSPLSVEQLLAENPWATEMPADEPTDRRSRAAP